MHSACTLGPRPMAKVPRERSQIYMYIGKCRLGVGFSARRGHRKAKPSKHRQKLALPPQRCLGLPKQQAHAEWALRWRQWSTCGQLCKSRRVRPSQAMSSRVASNPVRSVAAEPRELFTAAVQQERLLGEGIELREVELPIKRLGEGDRVRSEW